MLRFLYLVLILLLLPACSTISYYAGAIKGHTEILNKAEPIDDVLARETTTTEVRTALINVQQARNFASQELLLPDNDSYREYADIGREYAVWNVIATREFSVDAKTWCYPFTGCVNYKGFHNQQAAQAQANDLREQGYDVYVAGARAYSTLGWFDDPLLNTMLYRDEAMRVEVLFHELAHQKVFVKDDSAFNEAFATSVAQEGVRRWFSYSNNHQAYQAYLLSVQRKQEFNALLRTTRDQLKVLYQLRISPEVMRERKQALFTAFKEDYEKLKSEWGGDDRYDKWVAQDLNNAHLALVATYYDLVPAFKVILAQANGEMDVFYNRVVTLSSQSYEERNKALMAVATSSY